MTLTHLFHPLLKLEIDLSVNNALLLSITCTCEFSFLDCLSGNGSLRSTAFSNALSPILPVTLNSLVIQNIGVSMKYGHIWNQFFSNTQNRIMTVNFMNHRTDILGGIYDVQTPNRPSDVDIQYTR